MHRCAIGLLNWTPEELTFLPGPWWGAGGERLAPGFLNPDRSLNGADKSEPGSEAAESPHTGGGVAANWEPRLGAEDLLNRPRGPQCGERDLGELSGILTLDIKGRGRLGRN